VSQELVSHSKVTLEHTDISQEFFNIVAPLELDLEMSAAQRFSKGVADYTDSFPTLERERIAVMGIGKRYDGGDKDAEVLTTD
jgi:hypothetical protein